MDGGNNDEDSDNNSSSSSSSSNSEIGRQMASGKGTKAFQFCGPICIHFRPFHGGAEKENGYATTNAMSTRRLLIMITHKIVQYKRSQWRRLVWLVDTFLVYCGPSLSGA